jgi:hypothetical protein
VSGTIYRETRDPIAVSGTIDTRESREPRGRRYPRARLQPIAIAALVR